MLALIPLFSFAWWAWTAVTLGLSYLIQRLTQPKQPDIPSAEPDQMTGPTMRQGTKFTVNFGTNWIENPIVAWWGDTNASPIVRRENHQTYHIGHKYAVGLELIVTQGQNDGIIQLKAGDKVCWPDVDDVTSWVVHMT